jgi:hypothetical protein
MNQAILYVEPPHLHGNPHQLVVGMINTRRRRGATTPGEGTGESDLRRGGELQQGWRRNRSAAAESCGGGAGGKWRARAWGGISARCVFVRVRRDTARCSRRLTFGAPDRANSRARPKKIAAPPRIPRLLEGLFHLRAQYIGGFFSACAL